MARRGEEFARLNAGGGYSQALAVGKGFTGAERSATKSSLRGSGGGGRGGGGGGGGRGVMNAFARHQELIKNYHRCNTITLRKVASGVGLFRCVFAELNPRCDLNDVEYNRTL